MAEGSVDDIFVEIQVRLDTLESGLRNAERAIDSSTRRMNQATGGVGEGFGSITPNVQKALISLAALHVAIRTTESLTNVGRSAFQLMTADIEDSRQAAENFVSALENIPVLGPAFGAGRGFGEFSQEVGLFTRGPKELIDDFNKFFGRDFDTIEADLIRFKSQFDDKTARFFTDIDKSSPRFDETERRTAFAVRVGSVTGQGGKAAERELQILNAINKEERIRLKFVFQREDLERKIGELQKLAARASTGGQIGGLSSILGTRIEDFEKQMLELIAAREREALKKKKGRSGDPTETTITALGAATFGAGRALDSPIIPDAPTKKGQDDLVIASKTIIRSLTELTRSVAGIGFE